MSPREHRPPLGAADVVAATLTNARIAAVLAEVADLLEIDGTSSFKVVAYRRAADSVARAGVDVAAAYRAGEAPVLRGVGDSIAERIAELSASGRLAYHEALRAKVPPTLLELLAIPGVGPRTAGEAWRQLGVATLADLVEAARSGRLRTIRGISAGTEARIIAGAAHIQQQPARRMRLGEAHDLAERVVALIETMPGVRRAVVAGSVRRWRETVGDLDVLVETTDPTATLEALRTHPVVAPGESLARGADRASLRLLDGPQLDVMLMPSGAHGSYLVHLTGSAEHNVALRHRARERGWSLSEHGLVPLGDQAAAPLTFATEAELYAQLGLAEIPPELREGRGEVEAAAVGSGGLPRLLTETDLRGDCHSHTHWSDGREPLEAMVDSARVEGREYQALTDHSQSLAVANGLSPARVEAQRRLIGELNERFELERAHGRAPEGAHPGGFRLLQGIELEITADGRLDYDDAVLAGLDVVVASLHVGRRQPRAQLMARYELALRSPHVDIISHPSGRKIGQRPDLDLDWDAFYRLAAETGTLLEINGSEARLDLDERRIRTAREAGCRFVVSSDAHARSEWRHLRLGTHLARRGWVTPQDVANTLPLQSLLELLRQKPQRV